MRSKHVPIRMCVGCGERAPQSELIRLGVGAGGRIVVKESKSASGRSAYLHRNQACWDAFARRKGKVRSLGKSFTREERAGLVQAMTAGNRVPGEEC